LHCCIDYGALTPVFDFKVAHGKPCWDREVLKLEDAIDYRMSAQPTTMSHPEYLLIDVLWKNVGPLEDEEGVEI
jgi:hypothetical protein